MLVAELFGEFGLQVGSTYVDMLKRRHVCSVIHRGVNRRVREKLVNFKHGRLGAAHGGEPVVDDGYFRGFIHENPFF